MKYLILILFLLPFPSYAINKTEVIEATNNARATALVENSSLSLAAQMRADYMAASSVFSHDAFGLKNIYRLYLELVGYKARYSGENLARGFTDTASMHTALMASPTHKANIISRNYMEVGIGIATSSTGVYVVQMFGSPAR